MLLHIIISNFLAVVEASEMPCFVYNGSGYIFESTNNGWQNIGKIDQACLGTGQMLLSKKYDMNFYNSLYKLTLNPNTEDEATKLSKQLETLSMPNLTYIDMSRSQNADILCEGLSKNRTLRNIRAINADESDIGINGVRSVLNMNPLEDFQNYEHFLVRDMKTESVRHGVPVAQLQISVRNTNLTKNKETLLQLQELDGTISSNEWPISYICDDASGKAHLFFKIIMR